MVAHAVPVRAAGAAPVLGCIRSAATDADAPAFVPGAAASARPSPGCMTRSRRSFPVRRLVSLRLASELAARLAAKESLDRVAEKYRQRDPVLTPVVSLQ